MFSRISARLSLIICALFFSLSASAEVLVMIQTNMGNIEVSLNEQKAPVTVKNFLRYVKEGFYNGTIYHRVIPGFMIQGGGFTPNLTKKKNHAPIINEASNGLHNLRYTIAMARTNDPNSATSQFYINVADNTSLDATPFSAGYTVFGKVVKGQDVVDRISTVPTSSYPAGVQFLQDVPIRPVVIEKVYVLKQ